MGAIAERLADRLIVTDDNPRDEDPAVIAAEILGGIEQPEKVSVIHDRVEAIASAVRGAAAEDVVLVAGKGHEEYQEIRAERRPFSDRRHIAWLLGELVTL